jgi:hypothetical protein
MESNTPATTFKISLSEQTIYVNSFGNTCWREGDEDAENDQSRLTHFN